MKTLKNIEPRISFSHRYPSGGNSR